VQKIERSYDYLDFRPHLPPWVSFQPCELVPGGDGCECIELACASNSKDATAFLAGATESRTSAQDKKTEKQKRDLMLVCALFAAILGHT
jgi:hypothetical protein